MWSTKLDGLYVLSVLTRRGKILVIKNYLGQLVVAGALLLSMVACAQSALPTATPQPRLGIDVPVRIMPMGDSITEGICDQTWNCDELKPTFPNERTGIEGCNWALNYANPGALGYRGFLRDQLLEQKYQVEFVGSVNVVDGIPHEGHTAWVIKNLDYCVQNADWLQEFQPNMILLHIGTNDAGALKKPEVMIADLHALVEHIYEVLPETTELIIAQVLRTTDVRKNERLTAYNAAIPALVDEFRALGKHVSYVDMSGVIQSNAELDSGFGGVHPNAVAAERMAEVWSGKIVEILGQLP